MKADLQLISKLTSTLSGLSFATLSFGYVCGYSTTMPQAFRLRMDPFLQWTVGSAIGFYISCMLSFYAITFLNKGEKTGVARASIVLIFVGFFCYGFALCALLGIKIPGSLFP